MELYSSSSLSNLVREYYYVLEEQRRIQNYLQSYYLGQFSLSPEEVESVIAPSRQRIQNFIDTVNYLSDLVVNHLDKPLVRDLVLFPQSNLFYQWLQDVYYPGPTLSIDNMYPLYIYPVKD